MNARWALTLALALCTASALATGADAQAKRAKGAKGARINIVGCPYYGIPPGCILIGAPGAAYMLNSANPPVPVGTAIRLSGTPTNDPNICFATVLTNIKWRPVRRACQ